MADATWLDKVYALMREHRWTFGEAAAELNRRSQAVRKKNLRRAEAARLERDRLDRIGLS